MQQWRQLKMDGIMNPNPRQQTLNDMQNFIQGHIRSGNEVLVMISANSHSQDTNIQTFMEATGLHDVMEDYLPDLKPSTYQCGQNKFDHIWGTPGIITATINASILPFGKGPNSDHAVLYLDLSFDTLTGLSSQILCDSTHLDFEIYGQPTSKQPPNMSKLYKKASKTKTLLHTSLSLFPDVKEPKNVQRTMKES